MTFEQRRTEPQARQSSVTHHNLPDGHLYELRETASGWEARRAGDHRWRRASSVAVAFVRASWCVADPEAFGIAAHKIEQESRGDSA